MTVTDLRVTMPEQEKERFMKSFRVMSIFVCIVLLSGLFVTIAKASNQPAPKVAGHTLSIPPSISSQQIKDQVRKTFGQAVVDRMLYQVTKPLSTQSPQKYEIALHPSGTAPGSSTQVNPQAMGPDRTSSVAAGTIADLSGSQWALGAAGQFNVSAVVSPLTAAATWVGVASQVGSITVLPVLAGVDQLALLAYYQASPNGRVNVFRVNDQDQVYSEVYLWDQNTWFIFLLDYTNGQYFAQLVSSGANNVIAATWNMYVPSPGPVPQLQNDVLTFTQGEWIGSNSSGWQPIAAAPTYFQITLESPNGGMVFPSKVYPDTTFSMLDCWVCTP
jgi:hypothetical protein